LVNEDQGRQAPAVATVAKVVPSYPKTRRMRFRFGDDGAVNKYFVDGDIVYSHFVAGLSAGFPADEESFIRSVRRFADRITDPALKKRVAGFIGQESMHGQEHHRLNETLVGRAYQIEWLDRKALKERQIRLEQRLPREVHLAMTAAAEHYTAVLAERTLGTPEVQAIPGDASPELARDGGVGAQVGRVRRLPRGGWYRTHANRTEGALVGHLK
jgi:predicted metal-dependent hydrolase